MEIFSKTETFCYIILSLLFTSNLVGQDMGGVKGMNDIVFFDTIILDGLIVYDNKAEISFFCEGDFTKERLSSKIKLKKVLRSNGWLLLFPLDLNYKILLAKNEEGNYDCEEDISLQDILVDRIHYQIGGRYSCAQIKTKFIVLLMPKWVVTLPRRGKIKPPSKPLDQEYIKALAFKCW